MSDDRGKTATSAGRLSAEEAAELAGQVAALAKSGLPLDSGLRALADELANSRLEPVLREMADRIEAGEPPDEVMRSQKNRFPAHVRGLLLAGIRSGRLAEVMDEFVDLHNAQRELGRRVWLSLAYPILLMSCMSLLLFFLDQFVIDELAETYRDFNLSLPAMTMIIMQATWIAACVVGGGTVLLVLAVVLLASSIPGPPGTAEILYAIPLVGPLWRWSRLMQFSRMMGLLIAQDTPLPEALRLTAVGIRDANLATGCRYVAADVEAGQTLAQGMASYPQFPPTMIPLIESGQRTSSLPDAFEASAEMFEDNLESQEVLMEAALTPITFFFVAGFMFLFIIAMFKPLIVMIGSLS